MADAPRPVSSVEGLSVQEVRDHVDECRRRFRRGELRLGDDLGPGLSVAEFCTRLVVGQNAKRLVKRNRIRGRGGPAGT